MRQPLIEDDAIFTAPWQAQAFAMVVHLHERGHFSWTDWAAALSTALEEDGQPENSTEAYYRCWLRALEAVLNETGTVSPSAVSDLADAWQRAAQETPHGKPVRLGSRLDAMR
ncbi:MAG: nitrile hydratase accessory protein [Pseudomonadota bacterium]